MRTKKWWQLLTVMVLSMTLVIAVGCSDDDDDDDNPTGPSGNSAADMSAEQQAAVTEQNLIPNTQASVNMADNSATMVANGQWGGGFFAPQGVAEFPEIAQPSDDWEGPDGDGYYTYTETYDYDGSITEYVYKVKFTPDVWANPDQDATRVDVMIEVTSTYEGFSSSYNYTYWAELMDGGATVDGGAEWNWGGGDYPGLDDYGYEWGWEDVSTSSNDHSGHFWSQGTYPVASQTGYTLASTATDFMFEADGSGTGSGSVDGQEWVRFVVDAGTPGMRSGVYTLLSEDWAIEHPFTM